MGKAPSPVRNSRTESEIDWAGDGFPPWIRKRLPAGSATSDTVESLLREYDVETVCREARCPNIGECFCAGHATFMILGRLCTRGCGFCGVEACCTPPSPDPDEPAHIAEIVRRLELNYVVITSVTRDDLSDGGAGQFAAVINELRRLDQPPTVELLVPDFRGDTAALECVLEAAPDMLSHNVETASRLYSRIRCGADFERSLDLLRYAAIHRRIGTRLVKSGFMVGLGETDDEVYALLDELQDVGVEVVTIGQYLKPRRSKAAVERFVAPGKFERYREYGMSRGLRAVSAGPFVRSSYRAAETFAVACAAK